MTLNLFYEEPDPDRWFRFDRYPRKFIRHMLKGKPRPGGVMTIAINLKKGLDKLGIPYRFNDFNYIKNHPQEIACIIGKPQLLFNRHWENPVIFGAGVYSHPLDHPELFTQYPNVKRFLVPGEWMRKMCEPYYQDQVIAWPAGIDTSYWLPDESTKAVDFLIYDKIKGHKLTEIITEKLKIQNLSYHRIVYGSYTPSELKSKLSEARAAIFLSESETQGLAYQQILSTNTPVLAWDRGGYWQDPSYFPHLVKYQPVSSVPYWDDRCGEKFTGPNDFNTQLSAFMGNIENFAPRDYILEHLTLEKSATAYLNIVQQVMNEL